jgi:DNA-binding NarL/FixJ family response regulator
MHLPLDPSEVRDVFFASQRLLKAGNLDELRTETLTTLQRLFKADKSNFFLSDGDAYQPGLDLGKVVTNGVSEKNFRLFRQYYHHLDPFKNILKKQNRPPEVMTFDQIMPFQKLLKTEYYNDFLKPQNIHDQLTIYLNSENCFIGVAALFRPKNSPVFSSDDKAKAKLMVPFLTAAMERAISFKKNRVLEDTIRSITPDLPYEGIVLLDQSLTPQYYDDAADDILSRLHRSDRQQRSFPEDLPEELQQAVRNMSSDIKSLDPKEIPRTEVKLSSPTEAKPVIAQLRVLLCDNNTPKILICFNPTNKPMRSDSTLRKMGISTRELDIIHLVAKGEKNSEIASTLFISNYTVENHLRSIYRKMNVKNRTALVCKILKSSA